MGVARSGTSMVAMILKELGVNIGENLDPVNFEDQEIVELFRRRGNRKEFRKLVTERNQRSLLWGWKMPESFRWRSRFEKELNNPKYIIIFRDLLSVGLRNEFVFDRDLKDLLKQAHARQAELIQFVHDTRAECLLISYEKVLWDREFFVSTLIDFLELDGIAEGQRKLAASLVVPNRPQYVLAATGKSATPVRHSVKGYLNYPGNGVITGWLRDEDVPDRQLDVSIFAGDQHIITVPATQYREDLSALGMGTGNYGFRIDLKDFLPENGKIYQISAFQSEPPHYELSGSPFALER